MSAAQLKLLRAHCGVTQTEFAVAMGVPFRTYQDLEAGVSQVRPVHICAAKLAVIMLATVLYTGVRLTDDLDHMLRKALVYSDARKRQIGMASSATDIFEPLPPDFK
jgi:DNA-binding XRE family transcriptional regulator